MKYLQHLLIALALAGMATSTACTHRHAVTRSELDVVARSGQAYRADGTRIFNNEPWLEDDLDRVYQTSHARGAVEGMGIGALSGAAVGVLIGLAAGDDDCGEGDFLCFSTGEKAQLGGLALGGVGAVAGLLFGALAGSKDVYELEIGSQPVHFGVTPRGTAGLSFEF